MSYKIAWDEKARDFLRKLPKSISIRIIKKVNGAVDNPRYYLEALVNMKCYKLRVGDYRVLLDIDEENKILSVIFIGQRKNVYKHIGKIRL